MNDDGITIGVPRWNKRQFIEILIQGGTFNDPEYWEDEIIQDYYGRDGRTNKIDFYTESKWGRSLVDKTIGISESKAGKEFRRKFRVPYPVFKKILVPECDRLNVFEVKDFHRIRVPTEMKLLCIRIWHTTTRHRTVICSNCF